MAPEVAHRCIQCEQILRRHASLDVVDCVEHEAAVRAEDADALAHLGAHLIRRAERQGALRIHAAAPEGDLLAETRFELLRIHVRR